jgi:outer membrane translocation and assembly module TamA
VSLNGVLSYDSRDNIFTPSSGIATELKAMVFDDAWGSDDRFQKYKASFLYYTPLYDRFVLGFRGDARLIEGDAPFYSYPYIDMRGVKAMQYQGDTTLLSELELRWNVSSRWWLVGFGGVGKAYNDGDRDDSDTVYSKGLGFRYLIASKLGLQMGVDVASGPDDTAIYIQVGSSWALK